MKNLCADNAGIDDYAGTDIGANGASSPCFQPNQGFADGQSNSNFAHTTESTCGDFLRL